MNHPQLDLCYETIGPGTARDTDECPICKLVIEPLASSLTTTCCNWTFDLACVEEWLQFQGDADVIACPVCRHDLNTRRGTPVNSISIYPVENLTALRVIVGDEAFMSRPLTERISNPLVPLSTIDTSLAHQSFATTEWVQDDEFQLADDGPVAYANALENYFGQHLAYNQINLEDFNRAIYSHQPSMTAVLIPPSIRVLDIIQEWSTRRGIRFVEQYTFPEFDPSVRFIVPLLPYVAALSSINELRRTLRQDRITADVAEEPFWLTTTHPGYEIRNWVHPDDRDSRRIIDEIDEDYDCSWSLWRDNNIEHSTLYAVPRAHMGQDYGFLTDDGEIEHLTEADIVAQRDPLLSEALWRYQ